MNPYFFIGLKFHEQSQINSHFYTNVLIQCRSIHESKKCQLELLKLIQNKLRIIDQVSVVEVRETD